ncbi:MAG: TonB-dependent receptor [Deltaproteobacteria bacterium]|nr:TonB-dependent receptor [Deltaproteobacteria bacterium]
MKRRMSLSLFLTCITFLMSVQVYAAGKEQNGFEAFTLGEIYVKAEKPPLTQETAITTVITADEIKANNSQTVAEALRHAPGVYISTGTKNEPNVSIHGFFDQRRILVLIDGVPYYETKEGKLDLNQFTTDNVAKIEVTKGAASVLYGANAMGGVINIITKKAAEGKPFFGINLEGGQVDYHKESLFHGMRVGKFNYWLNYEHRQQHGWRMSDDYKTRQATITNKPGSTSSAVTEDGGTREQSDYSSDSIWAKFGVEPSAGSEYFINFHYISKEKGLPPSTDSVRVFTSRPAFSNFFRFDKYDDWGIDLSGQQKITDRLSFKGKLYYHDHTDELVSFSDKTYSRKIAVSRYEDYLVGGYLMAEYKPVFWNTARASVNYRGDSHKQRDDAYLPFENYFSYTGSVGIEDEIRFSKNMSAVVGASYDWFDVTDANRNNTDKSGNLTGQTGLETPDTQDDFNPMIGVNYIFADATKLFASAAKKTRFPTLSQLYSSSSGNKDLNAESAINYTTGISRSLSKYAWGEIALFYHDISDYIMRTSTDKTAPYLNAGEIRMYGVEISTEFYPLEALILKLGYTYNHAADVSPNKVTDRVAYVPEHTLNAGIQYTVPRIGARIDLNGLATSKVFTQVPTPSSPTQAEMHAAGYFVLNARLSQKFLKYFEAYIAANNLFDTDYEPESGYPAMGRNIFAGITVKF